MINKIAIFNGFYLPHLGGVERYTEKMSDYLAKEGYEIFIVTSNHDNLDSFEKDKNKKSIYRLPVYNLFKNRYPLLKKNKEYKSILKKLNNEKIDFIICNTRFYSTTRLAVKYAKKNDIPILCIEHGSAHLSVGIKILDFFGSIYEHFCTMLIKNKINNYYGVSEKCNNWLKHFNINARGVFYNSIDETAYDTFKNSKYKRKFSNQIVLCYVGRIIKEKGVQNLLDAFLELEKKYDNIILVIAGEGKDLEEYKNKYKNKKIFFEGKLPYEKVMTLLNNSDIFIHPSMYPEGLPTSILEAGIMENAILATNRGGTKEIISNDDLGIIIGETKASIIENLEALLENPNKIKSYQKNIHKEVIDKFTWNITCKKIINEIKKIESEYLNEKN